MSTVLKVQLPVNNSNPFAIFFNNNQTTIGLIKINDNQDLIAELMGENNSISYCQCEVFNGRITKVLKHVTENEFFGG